MKLENTVMSTPHEIPCFRCSGDAESYSTYPDEQTGACVSCDGAGVVVPGVPLPDDQKLVKKYVRSVWWKKIRSLPAGMKRGRKRQRDALIAKQCRELWADFVRMSAGEQRANRLALEKEVSDAYSG